MKEETYTIDTGSGREADVTRIPDQEFADHIRRKGYFGDGSDVVPGKGFYEYDAMSDGYIVYNEDFVMDQVGMDR